MDGWLRTMGFRDFSAEIGEARRQQAKEVEEGKRKHVGLSPVSDQVMAFSEKRYQAVNDARDLATWMFDKVKGPITDSPEAQARVAEFSARMLLLQPQELPDEWPSDVKTAAEREAYATRYISKQILNSAERVANDFMHTSYGTARVKEILAQPGTPEFEGLQADLKEVRSKVLSYMTMMRMDTELGQSNYLGDAVALSLVRHSRKTSGKDGPLEAKMHDSALRHGTHLENSISAEPIYANRGGKPTALKVNDGSFVYEYSGHREAADIAFAGRPGIVGTLKAYTMGLMGTAMARWLHWEDGKEPDQKTYWGRARRWLADRFIFNHGISHVGQAFHNVDKETGLVRVEVRDLYPDPVFGGSRIISMRNFAMEGSYRRLMVSTQDYKKLAKEFIRQVESSEDIRRQWKSNVSTYNAETESLEASAREREWPVLFDTKDIKKWVELAKKDPEAFGRLYVERARVGWEYFAKQGVHFDSGFTDFLGAGYCAKGCVLAPKLTMGLDVEPTQSRFAFPLSLLKHFGFPGLEDLPTGRRLVTPVSLALQPTTGKVQVIEYPPVTGRERQLARTEPFVPQSDAELRGLLQGIPWQGGHAETDTWLGDLLGAVEENVREYRLAVDKGGPSKMLGGGYAARARARREKVAADTEDREAKKVRPYNHGIGDRTVAASGNGRADLDAFLKRMGMDSYSSSMQKSLDEGKAVNPLAKATLEGNIERYKMVDTARELTLHIMDRAEPNLKEAAFRERFLAYAASLLDIKPETAVKEVPLIVRQNPDLLARAKDIENYFEGAELERGRLQLERLVSDYLYAMYGEKFLQKYLAPGSEEKAGTDAEKAEHARVRGAIGRDISKVTGLFADYLYKIHLDPHIGNTQWVGRGVALSIVRQARLEKNAGLEKEFSAAVRKHDKYLENYVSNRITMKDSEGRIQTSEVHTGSFAFVRSLNSEAAVITSAAIPHDTKQAKKEGLIGNVLGFFVPVKDKNIKDGLNPVDRLRVGLSQINRGNDGFSHVGQFIVHEDAALGMASTLVADNYPYHDESKLAGVRFVGLEHFANENSYGWVGIADIDPEKFHKYAQEMVEKTRREGWDPIAWKAYKPTVGPDGAVIPDANPPPGHWMKLLTKEEFETLHSEKDPKKWMAAWREALARGWRVMMEEGTHFSWVDNGAGMAEVRQPDGSMKLVHTPGKYYEQGTYCSQACTLASIRMTGIPLEEPGKEGQWAGFVKLLNEYVPIPAAKAIDTTQPIVPPVNLALMKWIEEVGPNGEHIRRLQFPVDSLADRLHAEELPPGVERNLRITGWMRSAPEFIMTVDEKSRAHLDPTERAHAIHAAMERTAIRAIAAGARNVKEVLGIDPEEIAALREKGIEPTPREIATVREAGEKRPFLSEETLRACQNAAARLRGMLP